MLLANPGQQNLQPAGANRAAPNKLSATSKRIVPRRKNLQHKLLTTIEFIHNKAHLCYTWHQSAWRCRMGAIITEKILRENPELVKAFTGLPEPMRLPTIYGR